MRRRLVRFAVLALAAPVLGRLVVTASERLEASKGPSTLSAGMRRGGALLARSNRLR